MSKLQVTFGTAADSGVVFVNPSNGKAETLAYEHPLEKNKALSALKNEVNARHNVSRAALSMLVNILALDRIGGYKGKGKLGEPGGIPNEAKSAFRDAETEWFKPLFPKVELMDTFLAGLREGGPYAVAKGICLKYFFYMGKLPCAYNADGTPDTTRLLTGNAMMKIMRNETPDSNPKTWGERIAELAESFKEACEKGREETADLNTLDIAEARAKQLLDMVKERRNVVNAAKTEHAAMMQRVKENPALALLQNVKVTEPQASAPAPEQVKAQTKGKQKQSEKAAARGKRGEHARA
jgi:hypothetical protein